MKCTQAVASITPTTKANLYWDAGVSEIAATAVTPATVVKYCCSSVLDLVAKNKYVVGVIIGGALIGALVYKCKQDKIRVDNAEDHSEENSISRVNMELVRKLNDASLMYDLTRELNEDTPVYPGDPEFKREAVCAIGDTSNYTMQHLHFCNHAGTHIDFPAHVIAGAKTSAGFRIQDFTGTCTIIDYSTISQSGEVSEKHLDELAPREFVFFRNAPYLSQKVVDFLIKKQIRLVGIDSLSVDGMEDHTLPVHNALLQRDILIVENLALDKAPCGRCFVVVAPLNVTGIDGVPVRVIMWRL